MTGRGAIVLQFKEPRLRATLLDNPPGGQMIPGRGELP
jgi:hypothetical protein